MESGAIPDDSITASSLEHVENHEFYRARLNSFAGWGAWVPAYKAVGEWLQVDLGETKPVTGTIAQGRGWGEQLVKKYKLQYSVNGTDWTTYASSDGSDEVI
ncbi:lactadherin-like [Branchiostoma floridae x Branchiostoma belcheri]